MRVYFHGQTYINSDLAVYAGVYEAPEVARYIHFPIDATGKWASLRLSKDTRCTVRAGAKHYNYYEADIECLPRDLLIARRPLPQLFYVGASTDDSFRELKKIP
jgi:hypothetical protein